MSAYFGNGASCINRLLWRNVAAKYCVMTISMPHDAGCTGDVTTKLVMGTEIIIMLKTQRIDQHCESSTLKKEWRCRKAFENKYISELLPFSVYDKGHKHAIEVDQWQLLIILPKHGNI